MLPGAMKLLLPTVSGEQAAQAVVAAIAYVPTLQFAHAVGVA